MQVCICRRIRLEYTTRWSKVSCYMYRVLIAITSSILTHLSRISFFTLKSWTGPVAELTIFGLVNFNRKRCKETVRSMIRRCVLLRLILFCTVCLYSSERQLGFYELKVYTVYKRTFKLNVCEQHMSRDMRVPTMWYVRPAKPQISLRIRAV